MPAMDLYKAAYRYHWYLSTGGRDDGTIEYFGQLQTDALNEALESLSESCADKIMLLAEERAARRSLKGGVLYA